MFEDVFVDRRLDRRGDKILEAMKRQESAIIHQFCQTHPEQAGAYRFFANEDVTEQEVIAAGTQQCAQAVTGRHVLAIEDTTSIDLTAHAGQLSAKDSFIGPLEHSEHVGFFVHPVLVVDAAAEFPLGAAYVHLWNRSWGQPTKAERQYKQQPFETKESARWVTSVQASAPALAEAEQVTVVADRESDIYEFLATVPDERTDVLIRACQDRRVDEEVERLFAVLAASPVASTYELDIPATPTRQARRAEMEVRYRQVSLQRPDSASKTLPKTVTVWAIETRECASTVPAGESPILWRLLTTHSVQQAGDAHRLIRWYQLRWLIEELFRVIKRQGLNVEASQLQTGQALRKLTVFAIFAALPILQLTLERDGKYGIDSDVMFSEDEVQYQQQLGPTLEGRTAQQQNPFPPRTLAWSAWMIGRLGGWKGYRSQSPPGYITMKRGMERFAQGFIGWRLGQRIFSQEANTGQEKDLYKE